MASKIKLEITTPCSENWDKMNRTEKGRFCHACQKQVIDFTGMSEQQLALFFKRNKNEVCGRLTIEQLDKELSIPRKRIHWFRYLLQVALPAMLFSSKGYTQGKVALKPVTALSQQHRDSIARMTTIINSVSGDTIKKPGPPAPVFDAVLQGSLGGISVIKVKKANRRPLLKKRSGKTTDILQCMKDTAVSVFKVYPNPVLAGGSLNIGLTGQLKEGYYHLEITAMDGKRAFTSNDLWVDRGARVMNIAIPALRPGNYALGLRNRKDGRIYSQMILVKAE